MRQVARLHPEAPIFRASIRPDGLRDESGSPVDVAEVGRRRCVAVSGVAQPSRFAAALAELDLSPEETFVFADHHRYGTGDLKRIRQAADRSGAAMLVTTEKDAVKWPVDVAPARDGEARGGIPSPISSWLLHAEERQLRSSEAVVDLMEVRTAPQRKKPRRSALRHRLEYAAFSLAVGALRMLPPGGAAGLGRALARVFFRLARSRRRILFKNLLAAFPEKPAREIAAIARGCVQTFGATFMDFLEASDLPRRTSPTARP